VARHANGTTDKVVNTGAGIQIGVNANQGFSFHFLIKGDAAPGTVTVTMPYALACPNANTVNTAENIGFSWDHSTAGFKQAAFIRTAPGVHVAAALTSVLSGGVWYAIGATWDGANLRAYLNGVVQATTAAANVQTDGVTRPLVSAFCGIGGTANFFPGVLAEAGLTFGVLTTRQMAALAAGVPWSRLQQIEPVGVQASPLYWPMFGDSPEPAVSDNRRNGVVTGTTVVNHPASQSLVSVP
jgi:hypothetical protein